MRKCLRGSAEKEGWEKKKWGTHAATAGVSLGATRRSGTSACSRSGQPKGEKRGRGAQRGVETRPGSGRAGLKVWRVENSLVGPSLHEWPVRRKQ